ncbi:MAG: hypothetical protein KAQ62_12765, partial [Cyclobacteriaceae bacterium]|nr:hypothetical protein [Cyclobacteriaceae bacterium]
AWMLRWMGDNPEDFLEENASIEKDKELWATKTGSVYDEPESRHPHEWVLDYLSEHRPKLESINTQKALKIHKVEIANSIEKVLNTNFDNIAVIGEFGEARVAGDISIRTFVLEPEAGIMLPGILLKSKVNNPQQDVILYIDQSGKSGILKDMDVVEQLLKEGYRICAVDLRGIGETSPDLKDKFWDFLAGKPIFGQRVQDILATTKWLQESEIKAKNIKLWATGTAALYGAFAGVLSDDISTFVLEKPLLSFENVVQVSVPEYRNEVMLPCILEKFDMPQVYQALCPRSVVVLNPHLADRTFAGESDIEKIDKLVSTTFKEMKIKKEWHIVKVDEQERKTTIIDSLTDD